MTKSMWTQEARAQAWKAYLRAKFPGRLALAIEYAETVEKQEGVGYWEKFEGEHLPELLADFEAFCKTKTVA